MLIVDIPMPRDCPFCPMAHYNLQGKFTGCEAVGGKKHALFTDKEYAGSSTRPQWCPIKGTTDDGVNALQK